MRGSARLPLAFLLFLCFLAPFLPSKNIFSPLSLRKTSDFSDLSDQSDGSDQSENLLQREKNTPFSLFRPPSALFAFGNEPRAKRRNMQERISDQSDGSD